MPKTSQPRSNGSTELVEVVPIEDLCSDPANLRKHPDRNRQAVAASLRRFGAARSVVMDGKGIIRAGNATLEAARAQGITQARIVEATGDELIVVRRRDWSETEATAYGIADNRAADLGANEWHDADLLQTIRSLQSEDFPLDAIGFTGDEADQLANQLANDVLPAGADGKEYDESVADDVEFVECPSCGHKFPK